MAELTPEQLRKLLRYDPNTGRLFWLARTPDMFTDKGGHSVKHTCAKWNAAFADNEAFTYCMKSGYRQGRIWGRAYLAHRVAWAIHYGKRPPEFLDHKDRDKGNNRIKNLRPANKSQNSANTDKYDDCSSRFRGVCWSKQAKKWIAYINKGGRRRYLGTFSNEDDAARAYDDAATVEFGQFANLNFSTTEMPSKGIAR